MDDFTVPTFIKWAGGKRTLLKELKKQFPKEINHYYEPFLGGGSVFFFVKKKYKPINCHISDINEDLIKTYVSIRDNPKKIINYLDTFKNSNSKKNYYKIRKEFNEKKIKGLKRCAAFIYLNKTCFNGLFRVNSKNEFNVPYANYKNPLIFSQETILRASELLQGVKITCQDYREILEEIEPNSFIYLDPCYDPIKKTSFSSYTPSKFSIQDRLELFKFIKKAKSKRARVLLSNNDIPEIHKLYSKFKIKKINANRFINSNGNGRGKITELLIST